MSIPPPGSSDPKPLHEKYTNINKQEEDSSKSLQPNNPLAYLQNYKAFWATPETPTHLSPALEKSVEDLIRACTKPNNANTAIQNFINANWKSLELPDCSNNLDNQQFLARKIAAVLLSHARSPEIKKKILLNIFSNTKEYLSRAASCIESDLLDNLEFRKAFDIPIGSKLSHLQILGMESHNKGKNPLYVEFTHKDQKIKIVFKPRSMIAEQLISSTEDSLFKQLDLPTYQVYNKDNYGYSEWLENKREENTFSSKDEIADYLKLFCKFDTLFSHLQISDLHFENVIVKKKPYFIDLEAQSPIPVEKLNTGLFHEDAGGLYFNAQTKNRIWPEKGLVSDDAYEELERPDFDMVHSKTIFDELGLLDEIIYPAIEEKAINRNLLSQKERGAIASVNTQLKLRPHRIIFLQTFMLLFCIKFEIKDGFKQFLDGIMFSLKDWGYDTTFDIEKLKEQFTKDVMNNDVPIFYYLPPENDSSPGKIYYGDCCFTKR